MNQIPYGMHPRIVIKSTMPPIAVTISFIFLPNVIDEPRPSLARLVLLGARGVTDRVVGSSAWLGSVVYFLLFRITKPRQATPKNAAYVAGSGTAATVTESKDVEVELNSLL